MHVSLAIKDACSLQVKDRACLPLLEPLLRGHWQLMPWLQRHIDIFVLLSGPEQLCLCHLPVHEARKSHSAIWDGPWWTHWVSCSQAGSHKASCLPLHAGSFAPSVPNDKWEVLPFFFQGSPWHMPETTVTRRFIWAHHQQHWQSSAGEEGWCTWNTRHCLLWWWDTSADTCHGSGVNRDGSYGLPANTWCPSALLIWQGAQVHSRLEVGIATCKWQLRPDHIDDQLCLVPQLQAFQEWCMVWRKEVCFEFFPGKWNKCPWAGFMVQFLACHGGVLVSLLSQPGLFLLYFVAGISCSRIRTSSGSTCPRSFKTLVFQRMPVLSWYGRNSHCDWPLGESKSWWWSNLDGSAGMMLPVRLGACFQVPFPGNLWKCTCDVHLQWTMPGVVLLAHETCEDCPGQPEVSASLVKVHHLAIWVALARAGGVIEPSWLVQVQQADAFCFEPGWSGQENLLLCHTASGSSMCLSVQALKPTILLCRSTRQWHGKCKGSRGPHDIGSHCIATFGSFHHGSSAKLSSWLAIDTWCLLKVGQHAAVGWASWEIQSSFESFAGHHSRQQMHWRLPPSC